MRFFCGRCDISYPGPSVSCPSCGSSAKSGNDAAKRVEGERGREPGRQTNPDWNKTLANRIRHYMKGASPFPWGMWGRQLCCGPGREKARGNSDVVADFYWRDDQQKITNLYLVDQLVRGIPEILEALDAAEKRDAQRSGDDVPMTPVEKLWVIAPNTAQTETPTSTPATPSTQETVLVERLKEVVKEIRKSGSVIALQIADHLDKVLRTATHPEKTTDGN